MLIFKRFGTQAMLIEWEQVIHPTVHEQVIQLYEQVKLQMLDGVLYLIPAYCSMTIGFDNTRIHYEQLCVHIQSLVADASQAAQELTRRNLLIPVCYEPAFALDIPLVVAQTKLTPTEVVELHTSTTFQVYMLGFLPGFPYLGCLPQALQCQRHPVPRTKVPTQSVGLAGNQTGIYPSDAPGGWMIIGRTPIRIFDPHSSSPFYFKIGDQVRFYAISSQEFEAWS